MLYNILGLSVSTYFPSFVLHSEINEIEVTNVEARNLVRSTAGHVAKQIAYMVRNTP